MFITIDFLFRKKFTFFVYVKRVTIGTYIYMFLYKYVLSFCLVLKFPVNLQRIESDIIISTIK